MEKILECFHQKPFFSIEERMTWTSWMTWRWVNYQQKFFQKWTTPLKHATLFQGLFEFALLSGLFCILLLNLERKGDWTFFSPADELIHYLWVSRMIWKRGREVYFSVISVKWWRIWICTRLCSTSFFFSFYIIIVFSKV